MGGAAHGEAVPSAKNMLSFQGLDLAGDDDVITGHGRATSGAASSRPGSASGVVSGARGAGIAVPEVVVAQPLIATHASAASAGRREVTGKSNNISACCAWVGENNVVKGLCLPPLPRRRGNGRKGTVTTPSTRSSIRQRP